MSVIRSSIHARQLSLSGAAQVRFLERLSLYLNSGIPLLEALRIMGTSTERSVARVSQELERRVCEGEPLSMAVSVARAGLSRECLGLIRVGELSGTLPTTLDRAAEGLRRRSAARSMLIGTAAYPALLLCGAVAITTFLIVRVFPLVIPILSGMRVQLPISTRLLISISEGVSAYGIFIAAGAVFLIIALVAGARSTAIRAKLYGWALNVPVISPVIRSYVLAGLYSSLASLLASGQRLESALRTSADSLSFFPVAQAVSQAADSLLSGVPLSNALDVRLFPSDDRELIATGERSGALTQCLSLLARKHEASWSEQVRQIVRIAEPLLLLVIAGVILFVAFAIIGPIYAVTGSMNNGL